MMTLAQKTLSFWNMSKQYHGRSKTKLTNESAIKALREIVTTTSYERPLKRVVDKMYIDVIYGPSDKPEVPCWSSTVGMIKREPS